MKQKKKTKTKTKTEKKKQKPKIENRPVPHLIHNNPSSLQSNPPQVPPIDISNYGSKSRST